MAATVATSWTYCEELNHLKHLEQGLALTQLTKKQPLLFPHVVKGFKGTTETRSFFPGTWVSLLESLQALGP